ncbi:EsaB/YukD family protein [Ureibacillus sp. 179-F W5.1 NHS]|uniref:Methyltransferase n=2 Tax=Bacillales TaxID=1385 RepID=A0A3M8HCJ5_9BACI|nr:MULTISPECIES: EsaB/YukD family protein [Bacillales]MBD8026909.1 methyltransferase [Ureibacillus galli]RNC99800.1 methyltransferase [Lysinibacillus halotolerans]
MNKVLVEIFLPASNRSFDVYLPLESRLSEVLPVVSALITDLSGGTFKANNETILCDFETSIIFNINMTVSELGIQNGSKLMLI